MQHLVAPSMLSSDFTNLQSEIEMVNISQADWFHLDVMDGMFVPNITFGMPVIKKMKKHAEKPFDVHLMINDPDRYLKDFVEAGADILTVQYEACTHLHRTIQKIHELGIKAGVALNPHTPVAVLEDIVHDLDMVLIMSVNPGFGGQDFIENTFSKIRRFREMTTGLTHSPMIEVDGGVTLDNAAQLVEAGVDILVAGSTIFKSHNPEQTIAKLKNTIQTKNV